MIYERSVLRTTEGLELTTDGTERDLQYSKLREEWLRDLSGKDPDFREPRVGQQVQALFRALSASAQEYAARVKLHPQSYEELLQESYAFVSSLSYCFVHWEESGTKPSFWLHRHRIAYELGAEKDPYIDKRSLEQLVDTYLQMPIRSAPVERCIADGLVAAEIYAYASDVLVPPRWHNIIGTSRVRGMHVIPLVLLNALFLIVVLGGLAAIAAYGNSFDILPINLLGWVAGILVAILVVLLAVSFISLPFAWWKQKKGRKKIGTILTKMVHAYSELDAEGPVSASRFERALEEAATEGAAWPAPLFVLVEDIRARLGRF